jgi:hypothetical protein
VGHTGRARGEGHAGRGGLCEPRVPVGSQSSAQLLPVLSARCRPPGGSEPASGPAGGKLCSGDRSPPVKPAGRLAGNTFRNRSEPVRKNPTSVGYLPRPTGSFRQLGRQDHGDGETASQPWFRLGPPGRSGRPNRWKAACLVVPSTSPILLQLCPAARARSTAARRAASVAPDSSRRRRQGLQRGSGRRVGQLRHETSRRPLDSRRHRVRPDWPLSASVNASLTTIGCQEGFHCDLLTLGQVALPPRGAAARGIAESAPPAPSLLGGKRAAARLTPAWSDYVGHDVTRCGGTPPRAARRRPPR